MSTPTEQDAATIFLERLAVVDPLGDGSLREHMIITKFANCVVAGSRVLAGGMMALL